MAELDKDQIRKQILDKLRRVPDWVATSNVGRVREYKKFYASVQKTINNSKATLQQMQAALNQVDAMYR